MTRRPPTSTLFPCPPLSRPVLAPGVEQHHGGPLPHGESKKHVRRRRLRPLPVRVGDEHEPDRPRLLDALAGGQQPRTPVLPIDRQSTRLNSSHLVSSYADFC